LGECEREEERRREQTKRERTKREGTKRERTKRTREEDKTTDARRETPYNEKESRHKTL